MGANRTVVVVDDDELMRAALLSVLEASDYAAVVYATAEDALGGSALARAHCAILDVGLPGMSVDGAMPHAAPDAAVRVAGHDPH